MWGFVNLLFIWVQILDNFWNTVLLYVRITFFHMLRQRVTLMEPIFKFGSQCGASSTYCLFGQKCEDMLSLKRDKYHGGQLH